MSTGAPEEHDESAEAEAPESGSFARAAKMALIVFAILLSGIALASWLGGDSSTLPVDYDGFD
jgi:hypothetical protein